MVEFLVGKDANVNEKGNGDETALSWAAYNSMLFLN